MSTRDKIVLANIWMGVCLVIGGRLTRDTFVQFWGAVTVISGAAYFLLDLWE